MISGDIYQIDSFGTLRIDNTQLIHSGIYHCLASNPAGKDTRKTIVVVQGYLFIVITLIILFINTYYLLINLLKKFIIIIDHFRTSKNTTNDIIRIHNRCG